MSEKFKPGAKKKYYNERMLVRFELDVTLIGQLDELALKDGTSRTEILTRAANQYINKRAK